MSDQTDNGRATMRDVVDIVTSTRKELNDSIGVLSTKFDAFVTSNEHRLTVVEMHQATQANEMSEIAQRLNRHGEDIGILKDQQTRDEAATQALTEADEVKGKRWISRNALIVTLCSVIFALTAVLALFH